MNNAEEFLNIFDNSIKLYSNMFFSKDVLPNIINNLSTQMKVLYQEYKDDKLKVVWTNIKDILDFAQENKRLNRDAINQVHKDIYEITGYKSGLLEAFDRLENLRNVLKEK